MAVLLRLFITSVFLVVGSASKADDQKVLNVLFINPGFADGFWGSVTETMRAAAEDLDINLTVLDADRDRIKMLDLTREALSSGQDWDYAVIVNELQQGPILADALDAAGVEYLMLLNGLSDQQLAQMRENGGLTHYIGSVTPRNFLTGYHNTRALLDAVEPNTDTPIRVLALLGDTATPAAVEREAGMRAAVAEAGNAEIVRAISVDWLFDRAKSTVALFLGRETPDIIWTASGPIAFGAMAATKEAGLVPGRDIKFAGVGWFQSALDAVERGQMTTTYGGYFISGAWSMIALRDHAAELELENDGEIEAPLSGVDENNIAEFQRLVGGVDWNNVEFSTHIPQVIR
ncbi:MAG: ABC transporter substrate-binding protein [Litoreibacter sp.]|nr:ABC transporter substrate-binding protein [Litoreibacter sp.]